MIEVSHDLFTHRNAWRIAIENALFHAHPASVDVDDQSYWQHELDAFDRVFEQLEILRQAGKIVLD